VNLPDTTTTLIIVIVVLAIGIVLGMAVNRQVRTQRLKRRFGPEYDRMLEKAGGQRQAERELSTRLDHVKSLPIRSLSKDESERFSRDWRQAQARFVDEPFAALQQANQLIRKVLETRGYEVSDFEQRLADLSVHYPKRVQDYRELHDLAKGPEKSDMDTEDLRQVMLRSKTLFDELATRLQKNSRNIKEEL
jgi:hypothetical protein